MLPSLTFLLAATILAITPGPGIAYVVARTVSGGRAEGIASCVGTAVGGMVHVLAAALGLSLLLAESALAFSVVKYLGAAYLVCLGVRLWRQPGRGAVDLHLAPRGARNALRDGALVEIFNVKTALFFIAFIPQFVTHGPPIGPQFLVLGTICAVLNTLVDIVAVLTAHRFLEASPVRAARERVLARGSALTMMALGVYVAFSKRQA